MKRSMGLLVLLGCVLVGGCQAVAVGGTGQTEGTRVTAAGEPEPCELMDAGQRARLGLGNGEAVPDAPISGAALCGWFAADTSADSYQGGVLPSNYRLVDAKKNYASSRELEVAGHPAVVAPLFESMTNETCIVLTELKDGRLVYMSFWAGRPAGATAEVSCRRATSAAEMVVQTMGSR